MSIEDATGSDRHRLPLSPSIGPAIAMAEAPQPAPRIPHTIYRIIALSIGIGILAALSAQLLVALIAFITNIAFHGRMSLEPALPAASDLGWLIIIPPVVGGLIVGYMAKYGSAAIRGHGIPEAMEQVLTNESRIPARLTILKPLSAAISIGTGGPFGAEGPIIATGGSLGSLVGQVLRTTSIERKTLLAAGAAAGMAATFGAPVSAVLLAIELLLFEFQPRSLIPVALASASATGVRIMFAGFEPVFPMPDIGAPGAAALALFVVLGVVMGAVAVAVTKVVYAIEDAFELLPVHWMWWPAIGAVAVGVIGYFAPRTLGVGYDVITDLINGNLGVQAILVLCSLKFISWSIALGSGTSGGTLAPLFMIGGGAGALLATGANAMIPGLEVDLRVAALVGMASMFAGASRAMLASTVFAFETTLQPATLLPLLAACSASGLVASALMRESIMTEKIARRGVRVPAEYAADVLDRWVVKSVATPQAVTLRAGDSIGEVRHRLDAGDPDYQHQGYPVVDDEEVLRGVVTLRDLRRADARPESKVIELIRRPPVIVYTDSSLREAVDHMIRHDVGRLPVVNRENPQTPVGIITRSDILGAYQRRIREETRAGRSPRGAELGRRSPE